MNASGTGISLCVYLSLCAALSMYYVCCLWKLWMGTANAHAIDVDDVCVCAWCVFSFDGCHAISVCLGLKAPVSEGVSGGHLNRICCRIV